MSESENTCTCRIVEKRNSAEEYRYGKFIEKCLLCQQAPALKAENERLKAQLETTKWVCFHCGFEATDPKEAASHFGDRDDEQPMCLYWAELDADGRLSLHQSVSSELEAEREENATYRTKVEGLEYRLDEFENLLHSRFKNCRTINDAYNLYDSMKGRALAVEERLDAQRVVIQAMLDALTIAEERINFATPDTFTLHGFVLNEVRAAIELATKTLQPALATPIISEIEPVYLVGGVNEKSLRHFVWGYFWNLDRAVESVLDNETDINEAGYYPYAVIVEAHPGLGNIPDVMHWFHFQDGKYTAIQQPEWTKHYGWMGFPEVNLSHQRGT